MKDQSHKLRRKGHRPTFAFVTGWDLKYVGGVNQVVTNLMHQVDDSPNFRPLSIVNEWEAKRPRLTRRNGRPTLLLAQRAPSTIKGAVLGALMYILTLPWNMWLYCRIVRRLNIRVVNFHYPNLSAITWIVLRRLHLYSGKVILSLHGRDVRDSVTGRAFDRWWWRWMMRHADRVVSCSKGLEEDALRLYPHARGTSEVIYNGVDANVLLGLPRSETSLPPGDGPLLVNLGTYEHKKGQDLLLRAFARIAERLPTVRLAIAGRVAEPATLARLDSLIDELKIRNRVVLHGDLTHAQAATLLAKADLFVLPSRNEGFAIVLLEAGIMAKPVVATDICGVSELIANDVDGIVVPADDVERLADAIVAELSDPGRAQRHAQNLNHKVTSSFTWRQTWLHYERILGSSEPS